jgi:hypothetical protein
LRLAGGIVVDMARAVCGASGSWWLLRGILGRPAPPLLGAAPLSGRYGVMAMATGLIPTLMARPAALVAVLIGVTVPEMLLAT